MMTKRQLAECIVLDYARHNSKEKVYSFNDINPKDYISKALSSTHLGIALEYLGYINPKDTPDIYEYMQHRGGVGYIYGDFEQFPNYTDIPTLSLREIFELLPDEIPKKPIEYNLNTHEIKVLI